MSLDSILIINRSGGLIYNKSFNNNNDTASGIGSNELLILAGTLHSAFTLTNCILPDTLTDFSESYNEYVDEADIEKTNKQNNSDNTEIELPFEISKDVNNDNSSNQKKLLAVKSKYYPPGVTTPNVNINTTSEQNIKLQSIIKELTFKGSDLFTIGTNNTMVNNSNRSRIVDYHQVSCIRQISTEHLNIYCHQSITGTKFISIFKKTQYKMDIDRVTCFLMRIYSLYSDIILKNPFYSLDMPIRNNNKFDNKLERLVTLETFA